MKPKLIAKITIDIAMTAALLLLMTFELIGAAAHEWLGIGIFALFIIHHILNGKWSGSVFKGKYPPIRVFRTVLVVLVMISMLGSMISGIILSRYALAFIPINGGQAFARTLHMLSAYWGYVLMSIHLGLHWSIIMNLTKRVFKKSSAVRKWARRRAPPLQRKVAKNIPPATANSLQKQSNRYIIKLSNLRKEAKNDICGKTERSPKAGEIITGKPRR